MGEEREIATELKLKPHEVWKLAMNKGYPMVAWSLPQQDAYYLLVDTRPQLNAQSYELEEIGPGFLINEFLSSHPCKSLFLKADILVISENNQSRTQINPTLSASELDEFLDHVRTTPSQKTPAPKKPSEAANYPDLVHKAIGEIKQNHAQKIVLARFEDHPVPANLDYYQKFEELNLRYPNAMTYTCHLPGKGVWIGATPEELIELRNNKHFRTVSLAGTQMLPEDAKMVDITWKQKEIEEQALVSRYIIDCFKKIRLREFDEFGPKTVQAGQLAHLKTQFLVDMEETHSPRLGTTMLNLLHPTSAVCGMPLDTSSEFIRQHEGFDREFYAGFLGPVQIGDSTNLFVNLRCAKIQGDQARFYAGAGITEDSDPEKELIETDLKLKTMKRVILNP